VLLIGDVALAHDIGGLLAASRLGMRLVIVLVDNGGGGIFDFLPVATSSFARYADRREREETEDLYTRHIATPTGLDFASAAGLFGLSYEPARDVADFRAALEHALADSGSTLLHVRGDRERNATLHAHVWDAVARALSPRAGGAAPTA
jgi:2-succinyl-5-enolpyruvyl-6-hydroxy-3-cyclohexene-1-carboxylate synthase